tara:strand:+ start:683 stop:889 length:207 start_codon:yes stop_codon:yes gene_type:complete
MRSSLDDNIDDFNHMVDRQLKVSFPFDDVDASEEENVSQKIECFIFLGLDFNNLFRCPESASLLMKSA